MQIEKTTQLLKEAKDKVHASETEARILKAIEENRDRIDKRFPFGTAFVATVCFVMVLYGLEKIIDSTFFAEHPWFLVGTGVVLLFVSGSIYRKL